MHMILDNGAHQQAHLHPMLPHRSTPQLQQCHTAAIQHQPKGKYKGGRSLQAQSGSNMSSKTGCRVWTPAPPLQPPFCVCDHSCHLPGTTRQSTGDPVVNTGDRRGWDLCGLQGLLPIVGRGYTPDDAGVQAELEPQQEQVLSYGLGWEKPKHSKDIALITLNIYKQNP